MCFLARKSEKINTIPNITLISKTAVCISDFATLFTYTVYIILSHPPCLVGFWLKVSCNALSPPPLLARNYVTFREKSVRSLKYCWVLTNFGKSHLSHAKSALLFLARNFARGGGETYYDTHGI